MKPSLIFYSRTESAVSCNSPVVRSFGLLSACARSAQEAKREREKHAMVGIAREREERGEREREGDRNVKQGGFYPSAAADGRPTRGGHAVKACCLGRETLSLPRGQ